MLTNVKPETVRRGILYIDGTMEIFTASDGGNRELHGAAANEYPKKGRVSDLISLAFLRRPTVICHRKGMDAFILLAIFSSAAGDAGG